MIVVGYLCGSLPTGVWLGRLAGVDVRASGSGNVGATNVARTVGLGWGLLTLALDAGKGAIPVLATHRLGGGETLSVVVGLAAFYGHIFPVFSAFRGGKGIATAAGVFAAAAPAALAIALIAFVLVVALTRIVSLASLAAAVTLPVAAGVTGQPSPVLCSSIIIAVTVVLTHRENLRRILSGGEARFAAKR